MRIEENSILSDYVYTFSGNRLHFLKPKEDEITIEDIANNLSKNCRYCGNIKEFYSVAEHSVLLAAKVLELTGDTKQALSALLHDATEAYLCDIPRPIKPHLIGYTEMESKLNDVILSKFGVDKPNDLIKYLDCNIVADEASVLFNTIPDWVNDFDYIGIELQLWDHDTAKASFIDMYNLLKGEGV